MAEALEQFKPKKAGALREIPVYSAMDLNTVRQVRSALYNLLLGQMMQAADVFDAMLADARILSALSTRANGLLGCPVDFDPRGDGRRKRSVADELEKVWDTLLPEEQASQVFLHGLALGAGLGQLTYTKTDKRWTPSLRMWHPRNLYWRWDEDAYFLNTLDGQVQLAPGNGEWVLYTPYGMRRGWAYGLVRALAVPWMCRTYAIRDWARHSEIHGIPTRKAIVPSNADKETAKTFFQAVVQLANEPVVQLERDADGKTGYDIEFLQAAVDSYEVFLHLIEQCDKDIAIAVLGQNLTTEISKNGSRAAAEVHDEVRLDYKKRDGKTFSTCIQTQVIRPWAILNPVGDVELAPKPCYQVEPPEDLGQKATTLKTLGDGLTQLKAATPLVDVEAVLEEYGVPMLSKEAVAAAQAEEAARQAEAQKAAAQSGQGGAGAGAAGAGAAARPGPGGGGKGQQVQASLAAGASDTGLVRGQVYVDAVADVATAEGKQLLSSDLHVLLRLVQEGKSYEEIRAALLKAYEGMSPERLARLTEKAILLGKLAGRNAVLEDA